MKIIYLHIGQPRSGSTFLQTKYFNRLTLNFVGKPYSTTDKKKEYYYYKIEREIFYLSDQLFNKKFNYIVKDYKKLFNKKKNLISIENIFGETKNQRFNFERSINRFIKIFSKIGKLKIIYILRSPKTFVISYLRYNIFDIITSKKIYDFKKQKFISKDILSIFNFSKKINFLNKKFKMNNIKYLFFEELNTHLIPEMSEFLNEKIFIKQTQKKKVNSMSIILSIKLILKSIKNQKYKIKMFDILKIIKFHYMLYFKMEKINFEVISILQNKVGPIPNCTKLNNKLKKYNYF